MSKKIYVIMVFEKLENGKLGLDLGCQQVIGYYFDFATANSCVYYNCLEMHEDCFNYAMVDELNPGLYPSLYSKNRHLYKYNKKDDRYYEIKWPKWVLNNTTRIVTI